MPDEKTPSRAHELSELEPLPDDAHEELAELPDEAAREPQRSEPAPPAELAELEPLPDGSRAAPLRRQRKQTSASEDEAASAAAAEALAGLRANSTSDQAPRMLKKAAMVCAFGSIPPWLATDAHIGVLLGSKAVVAIAAYLFHVCVLARAGEKVDKTFKNLTDKAFVDVSKRPRNFGESLLQHVPTPLHVIAWVFLVLGLGILFLDPSTLGKSLAEVGMLAWAAATFVHIDSYERGGKFNPIFPLMFLGHAVAGVLAFGTQIQVEKNLLAMAGSVVVAVGGVMAISTMFIAMKQAKVEGDLKKRAASEARKAARKRRDA